MAKTTDRVSAPAGATYPWCDWHKGPSGTAVLVDAIEQGSGPGVTRFACAPCREQRGLVPFSKQQP
ncbi:hypothetical protein ACIQJW_26925 [Streptomyces californicus]|uniref:hypothetical protein n=1 Tax=Streptomyces californicus TaxID=67351 RepID=UPI0038162168